MPSLFLWPTVCQRTEETSAGTAWSVGLGGCGGFEPANSPHSSGWAWGVVVPPLGGNNHPHPFANNHPVSQHANQPASALAVRPFNLHTLNRHHRRTVLYWTIRRDDVRPRPAQPIHLFTFLCHD